MYSFILSILALLLGYAFYGRLVEKVVGVDPGRKTPAVLKNDGVDFIPMPTWKVFMIQFLNIAGTGPIFGAIMGAKFGPSCYLWVVLGCIFAGAVHDFISGMLSLRNDGEGIPEIVGRYLGPKVKIVMLVFTVLLLMLVGAVFVYSPALILGDLAGDGGPMSFMIWVFVILGYYIVATLCPVDKIIGKIYPIFAFALIFMAMSLMVGLFIKWPSIPEIWDGLANRGPSIGLNGQAIFPCLFITVACGAISGFHATQSPLMARCLKNEKLGRPVFYGAMITEGIVALIWAAVSSYFFFDGGAAEVGSDLSASAPTIVTNVARSWLGVVGSVLALLGVVAAPITTGDTALRSCRLIMAEFCHIDQKPMRKRLYIAVPLFTFVSLLLWYNIADEDGFNTIWRYFGWANQSLACVILWAITVFLTTSKKKWNLSFLIGLIPAVFMTSVCVTYICTTKAGLNLPQNTIPFFAAGTALICLVIYFAWKKRIKV